MYCNASRPSEHRAPAAPGLLEGRTEHVLDTGSRYPLWLAWSNDGLTLAASDAFGITLWNTASGRRRGTIRPIDPEPKRLGWSADSSLLAAVPYTGGALKLWNPRTRRLEREIRPPRGEQFLAFDWSPTGTSIVTGSTRGTLSIWNATNGRLRRMLGAHEDAVHTISWSPDGSWIASGDSRGVIRTWKVRSGAVRVTIESAEYGVHGRAGLVALDWRPHGLAHAPPRDTAGSRCGTRGWRSSRE